MIRPQELRIGNMLFVDGTFIKVGKIEEHFISWNIAKDTAKFKIWNPFLPISDKRINPIPLTEENFLKHIDWDFEEGFNIKRKSNEYWEETCYLMENIIDGSGDFEVCFSKSKVMDDIEVSYWIDNKRLEFMLSDALHNFQNLFFTTTGQELPLKKQ